MNKGLFIHLVVTILVIASGLFIVGGEDWVMEYREGLVFSILIANLFTCLACAFTQNNKNLYSQRIKF